MLAIAYLRNRIFGMALLAIIGSCKQQKEQLPYYNTPDFTPSFISDKEAVSNQITHQIADFSFINQDGATITQKNIEGKIHVADFFFTSCGSICPIMTKNMSKINKAFEKDADVALLSYSVTPWIDDVKRLKAYALRNNINAKNWNLLTGNKAEIYDLARKSYFAEEDLGYSKDSTDFLHTEHFILVDKHKRIRGIYNGTLDLEIEQLIKDITLLKQEDE
ncbi:SCO family protein [Pelobium sp.]|nr:SCO family protein [Pelobium sp.]MDA9555612.1 SCO family protein [Pelobium sp.]